VDAGLREPLNPKFDDTVAQVQTEGLKPQKFETCPRWGAKPYLFRSVDQELSTNPVDQELSTNR
jgi:hypothetical protein